MSSEEAVFLAGASPLTWAAYEKWAARVPERFALVMLEGK